MGKSRSRDIIVSVIDSDLLMRQILSSMLRKETGVTLSGSSCFSSLDNAVSKIKNQQPDVVMLGVERADSEEMKFFYQLREEFPGIHVVLLTYLNEEGAIIALKCLKHGATDYITKPDKRKGLILASRHFQKRVLPVIDAIPRLNHNRLNNPGSFVSDRTVTQAFSLGSGRVVPKDVELLSIGGCMGAVTSLYEVVSRLPGNLPVPVVIVQHMPKIYTKILSSELDKITPLNVREARDHSLLLPGQVYVAPGGFHTVIKNEGNRKRIFLHRAPREHTCRPSIDVMLRSAVQTYDGKVLSVFLSGRGHDGILGASMVLDKGGTVLLESKESSLIWDLPSRIKDLSENIPAVTAQSIVIEIMKQLQIRSVQKNIKLIREDTDGPGFYADSFEP